jgi:hypothetical protein
MMVQNIKAGTVARESLLAMLAFVSLKPCFFICSAKSSAPGLPRGHRDLL